MVRTELSRSVACKTFPARERLAANPMKTPLLRLFLSLVTATACFAAAKSKVNYQDHIGIQMWSLRDTAKDDMSAALDLVKNTYGLVEIETAGTGNLSFEQFKAEVEKRGLKPVGIHAGYEALAKELDKQIATAKALGATYIVCPWIPHDREKGFTEELAREVAANFNKWGKIVSEAGLKLGWHPHGFEFVPLKSGNGETLFDFVAKETKPEYLIFEMDVFWVFHAGQDPVTLLKRYGDRWALMHVKDIRKGAVTGLTTGGAPPTDNVPVGTGQIDWKSVLRTAQEVGTQHFFIEDETPAPLQCIPQSLEYLRALKL